MELNTDLVSVQSILSNLVKKTGDFRKILYKGGNEDKILDLITELQKFLKSKQYLIKTDTINPLYSSELEKIILFLLLNTDFKNQLKIGEDFQHLLNIIPQLSKCLLVNTVFGLNLCEIFCTCLIEQFFTLEFIVEIFDECLNGLKFLKPQQRLECSSLILITASKKLSSTECSNKNEENVDSLVSVTDAILLELTGLYTEDTINKSTIEKQIGYTFLRLLELLLICDLNNSNVNKFVKNVIRTSCCIVKCITIDIYISWADILYQNQPLQLIISETAYAVIEKFNKSKEARDLVSMIGTMARKPLSLNEKIQRASLETVIDNIKRNDSNQKDWFKAFMCRNVLIDEKSRKCLEKYSYLCDEKDVLRLLCMEYDENSRKIVIKCASKLNQTSLINVMTKFYYEKGFDYNLNPNIQPQLVLLLNKLNDSKLQRNIFDFEILLLCLENFKHVLQTLYNECIKNNVFIQYLTNTFENLRNILQIKQIGLLILKELVEIQIPSENYMNFVDLFNTLLQKNIITSDELLMSIILPLIDNVYNGEEKNYMNMYYILLVLNKCEVHLLKIDLLEQLFRIMGECRCKFFDFNLIRMNIVKEIVGIVTKINSKEENSDLIVSLVLNEDNFIKYYKKSLLEPVKMLEYVCSDFNITKYAECVCKLLQVLPLCITDEWIKLAHEINELCDVDKTLQLYRDILVLICELVISQEKSSNNDIELVYESLKNCLQQYGIVLQQFTSTKENEILCAKHICRLISKIPTKIKEDVGVSLINLISNDCLQSLADNKEFVCLVVSINNLNLCKILSKRMLGQ